MNRCIVCGCKPRNVYKINGSEDIICFGDLCESSDYKECVECSNEGKLIAYEICELNEEDDGTYTCDNHFGSHHELTEDEKDLLDYFDK